MNQKNKRSSGEHEESLVLDSKLDQWIRDSVPEFPGDENRKEMHLSILKEKLRERATKRRHLVNRTTFAASIGIFIIFVVGGITDLGSDGYDAVWLEDEAVTGDIVKMGYREDGFNILEETSEAGIIELSQQVASSDGKVVKIEGWDLGEGIYWAVSREYVVESKPSVRAQASICPRSIPTRTFLKFLQEEWTGLRAEVESSPKLPIEIIGVEIDGKDYRVKKWKVISEQFGDVDYYSAIISR